MSEDHKVRPMIYYLKRRHMELERKKRRPRNSWKLKTYNSESIARSVSVKLHVSRSIVRSLLVDFSKVVEKCLRQHQIDTNSKLNPSVPKWFFKRHRKDSISKRKINKLIKAANAAER